MRCDDVIRELSRPGAPGDNEALSGHLARCGRCAAEADRIRRFERLWEATRPADPTEVAWDRAWTAIQSELGRRDAGADRPHLTVGPFAATDSRPAGPPRSATRWHSFAVIGMVGIAQAAALLLAIGLSWRDPVRQPDPVASPSGPTLARAVGASLDSEFDFEDGQVPLIRSDGDTVRMVDLTVGDPFNGEDPWMVLLNRVEGSGRVMAMAE